MARDQALFLIFHVGLGDKATLVYGVHVIASQVLIWK